MIVKHAHQKKMIDLILSSKDELKKEMDDDPENGKPSQYITTAENRLAMQFHFDYQDEAREIAQEAANIHDVRRRRGRPVRPKGVRNK